jgi:hypothetical protein
LRKNQKIITPNQGKLPMTPTKAPKTSSTRDRSAYAIASLIFGLLSLLAAYSVMVFLGGIMGLSGLVYAFVARDSHRRTIARIGAVISGLGLLANLLAAGIV